ncbi:hypothetical protein Pelo_6198 [Pelomyxa schiedti]|nr:hypothetical protein Pelo_6198 [Pelomyxa schiedti]
MGMTVEVVILLTSLKYHSSDVNAVLKKCLEVRVISSDCMQRINSIADTFFLHWDLPLAVDDPAFAVVRSLLTEGIIAANITLGTLEETSKVKLSKFAEEIHHAMEESSAGLFEDHPKLISLMEWLLPKWKQAIARRDPFSALFIIPNCNVIPSLSAKLTKEGIDWSLFSQLPLPRVPCILITSNDLSQDPLHFPWDSFGSIVEYDMLDSLSEPGFSVIHYCLTHNVTLTKFLVQHPLMPQIYSFITSDVTDAWLLALRLWNASVAGRGYTQQHSIDIPGLFSHPIPSTLFEGLSNRVASSFNFQGEQIISQRQLPNKYRLIASEMILQKYPFLKSFTSMTLIPRNQSMKCGITTSYILIFITKPSDFNVDNLVSTCSQLSSSDSLVWTIRLALSPQNVEQEIISACIQASKRATEAFPSLNLWGERNWLLCQQSSVCNSLYLAFISFGA